MNNKELLVEYILESEHEDFCIQLENESFDLFTDEYVLLKSWMNDEIGTVSKIKNIFSKLKNAPSCHIYVVAVCEQYKI